MKAGNVTVNQLQYQRSKILLLCIILALIGSPAHAFWMKRNPTSSSKRRFDGNNRRYKSVPFLLSSLALSNTPIEYADRFERWKFMQNILEGDGDADLANQALFIVLNRALQTPRGAQASEDAPEITSELRGRIEKVLETSKNNRIPALGVPEDSIMLQSIQSILPDPLDDEDAHKSTWDVVMQLHGRELVRISEQSPTYEWTMSCALVRLLLQYDFLEKGATL